MKNLLDGRVQSVGVKSSTSTWRSVKSGVPQGSLLGPVLFNIFISDIDSRIKCSLRKLEENMKPTGAVDTPEGLDAIQRDLDKPEKWVHVRTHEVQQGQVQGPAHGSGQSPSINTGWGVKELREALWRMHEKLDMSQQCGLICTQLVHSAMCNGILGCTKSSVASRSREVILSLYSALVRPHLESYIQLCSPQYRKDMDLLE